MLLAQELDEKRVKYQQEIKNNIVLKFLQTKTGKSFDAVYLAIALDLPVSLVRNELNRLVDLNKVAIANSPCQDRLNSGGLVYRFIQSKPKC